MLKVGVNVPEDKGNGVKWGVNVSEDKGNGVKRRERRVKGQANSDIGYVSCTRASVRSTSVGTLVGRAGHGRSPEGNAKRSVL